MTDASRKALAFGQLLRRDVTHRHCLATALAFHKTLTIELGLALHRAGTPLGELNESLAGLLVQAAGRPELAELLSRAEELQFDPNLAGKFVLRPDAFNMVHLMAVETAVFACNESRRGMLSLAVAACRGSERAVCLAPQ